MRKPAFCLSMAASLSAATVPAATLPSDAGCALIGTPILRFDPPKPSTNMMKWVTREATAPALSFGDEITVRGEHAACIELYQTGFILMRDGSVFRRRDDVLQRRDMDKSPFFNRPAQTGPQRNGHDPVSVAALSWSPGDKRRIGLWQAAGGSEVALFDAGTAAGAEPLLLGTTQDRLRGITFFPSPDAPSGGVTVIQEIGPEQVRIISGTLRYRDRPR